MIQELNIDEIVTVSEFSFINKQGGTGLSDGFMNTEKFSGTADFRIIKRWDDYECGERGWGVPISEKVIDYLKRNAMPGRPNPENHSNPDAPRTIGDELVVFISEFEIFRE